MRIRKFVPIYQFSDNFLCSITGTAKATTGSMPEDHVDANPVQIHRPGFTGDRDLVVSMLAREQIMRTSPQTQRFAPHAIAITLSQLEPYPEPNFGNL